MSKILTAWAALISAPLMFLLPSGLQMYALLVFGFCLVKLFVVK